MHPPLAKSALWKDESITSEMRKQMINKAIKWELLEKSVDGIALYWAFVYDISNVDSILDKAIEYNIVPEILETLLHTDIWFYKASFKPSSKITYIKNKWLSTKYPDSLFSQEYDLLHQKILIRLLNLIDKYEMVKQIFLHDYHHTLYTNFFFSILYSMDDSIFVQILKIARKHNIIEPMMTKINNGNECAYISFLKTHHATCDTIKLIFDSCDAPKKLLKSINNSGYNSLHIVVVEKSIPIIQMILELAEKYNMIEKLMTGINYKGRIPLSLVKSSNDPKLTNQKYKLILDCAQRNGLTKMQFRTDNGEILRESIRSRNIQLFDYIVELAEKCGIIEELLMLPSLMIASFHKVTDELFEPFICELRQRNLLSQQILQNYGGAQINSILFNSAQYPKRIKIILNLAIECGILVQLLKRDVNIWRMGHGFLSYIISTLGIIFDRRKKNIYEENSKDEHKYIKSFEYTLETIAEQDLLPTLFSDPEFCCDQILHQSILAKCDHSLLEFICSKAMETNCHHQLTTNQNKNGETALDIAQKIPVCERGSYINKLPKDKQSHIINILTPSTITKSAVN